MNNPASQPQCTSRAEWRLQTGKAAKTLSPHYRLGCDYGTAVIVLWKEGGGEPIYVCDDHAKQLGRSREHIPEARIVTAPAEQRDSPTKGKEQRQTAAKSKEQIQRPEVASKVPESPALPEVACCVAEVETKKTDKPEKTEKPEKFEKAEKAAKAAKAERAAVEIRERPSARDLTYGNPAKAMVDEAIWNLASGNHQAYKAALSQGKSSNEAAEAAGGQLAFLHRKINEYTPKLEAILSASQARINVEETVDKPLEQAMFEIISNDALSDSGKDAAIEQLGELQASVKQGLQGEITPVQANRMLFAIGDRMSWGGNSSASEQLKAVCRGLYTGLRAALCTAIPEAQNLHERLTNLYAAKSEMEAR